MILWLVRIAVAMIDPLVAAVGIGTGLLWAKHRVWATILPVAGLAGIVLLAIARARPGEQVFIVQTQMCALILWALLAHWAPRLWRSL